MVSFGAMVCCGERKQLLAFKISSPLRRRDAHHTGLIVFCHSPPFPAPYTFSSTVTMILIFSSEFPGKSCGFKSLPAAVGKPRMLLMSVSQTAQTVGRPALSSLSLVEEDSHHPEMSDSLI